MQRQPLSPLSPLSSHFPAKGGPSTGGLVGKTALPSAAAHILLLFPLNKDNRDLRESLNYISALHQRI